jgi:putative transcriptional regulator
MMAHEPGLFRALPRVLWLAPLVLLGALPGPGAGTSDPHGDSLVGQFLVAAPDIGDPRFAETVILMVHHDAAGALGIAINRPIDERALSSLLEALGDKNSDAQGSVMIHAGGPVEPEIGFVIHTAEYHRAETIAIDANIAVTSSLEILRDIGHNKGPAQILVAFGYSGWGPGQLEAELAQHAWYTEPADQKLIFDEDRDKVWKDALQRRSRDL